MKVYLGNGLGCRQWVDLDSAIEYKAKDQGHVSLFKTQKGNFIRCSKVKRGIVTPRFEMISRIEAWIWLENNGHQEASARVRLTTEDQEV